MSNWVQGNVETNGITVHYHRTGSAGKPVLLLLHGITDSGRVWVRVAGNLADGYDIITTDARGHGESSDLTTGFSIPMLADDTAGVITGLGLQRPFVWGHSMGAITAATLAANYPELVRAVVLEDPPLVAATPDPGGASREQDAAASRPAFPDFRAMSSQERLATAAAMNPGWHPDELPPWAESKAQFDPAIGNHFASFQGYPWRDVLARIVCPALLITADPEAGAIVTPAVAQEAAALLKQGQVVHIPGSGHNIHREQYEQTMLAVTAFLQAH
jgi:pimeloyl-ACP methyl ester carboxylesterase